MTTTSPLTTAPGSGVPAAGDGHDAAVEVRPLTGLIGAEIRGVDLSGDLSEATFGAIRQALLARRVVFFREQHGLDSDGQIAFAGRFGALTTAHPTVPSVANVPPLLGLDSLTGGGRADQWHTDVTFVDQPPDYSLLRAVVLPEVGGDTLWASTVAAYDSLAPELQQLAEQLRTVHTNAYDYTRLDLAALSADFSPARAEYLQQFVSTVYETEHPLVRVHPETGEKALLLGGFAQRVVGYRTSESADLLRLFGGYVTRPEHTVRWQWQEGDLAIWDNRSTQHYATYDYGPAQRKMERVTTVGSVPVGVDGRPSRALQGDATQYNAAQYQAEAA